MPAHLRAGLVAALATLTLPAASPAQSVCGLFEAVEPGDTFETIALRCGVPQATLAAANPGADPAAPEVASVVALTLPGDAGAAPDREVAGTPVSPGPKIVAAPADDTAPVLVIEEATTERILPGETLARALYLDALLGLWVRQGQACADPAFQWTLAPEMLEVGGETCAIEDFGGSERVVELETLCGENGVVIGRGFAFEPVDPVTLAFKTGDRAGLLSRCVVE